MTLDRSIAIVPARGGSKRIPRKNVRPLLGTPLIAWTLSTLRSSELFERIVVSTDDPEIGDIATEAGAEVPFIRPPDLADDHTPTAPVIVHALDHLGITPDSTDVAICAAYPAAALVTVEDLVASRASLARGVADHVMTACEHRAPILRAWRQRSDGTAEMLWPEHANTRSQDLEPTFYDAGQFYWSTADAWYERSLGQRSAPVAVWPLPPSRAVDLDTEDDWEILVALAAIRR